MFVLIGLGPDREYLGVIEIFKTHDEADNYDTELQPLIEANITTYGASMNCEGMEAIPLKERLQLAPKYFVRAGYLHDTEIIDATYKEC